MNMLVSKPALRPLAHRIVMLDSVFILRQTHFFPLWATFFSGYVTASQSALFSISPFPFLACLVATLTAGHVYLFNQLADIETDKINGKLFILADSRVSRPIIWAEGIVLIFLSLGLSWLVSPEFFLTMVFANAIGLSYTFLGIMNRPIPSLVTNSLGGCAAFLAGAYSVDTSILTANGLSFWDLMFWSLPHTFAYAAVSALVTLPDMPGDAQCGKQTIALAYGVQRTLQIALFSDALALFSSLLTMNWHCIFTIGLAALISLPLFWRTARHGDSTKIFVPVKYSMLALTLSVSLFFPPLLLLVVLNFFACRAYYRSRFGVNYPNFQPA
jgi:4-hydroxybenzoate polyprenyltransferase